MLTKHMKWLFALVLFLGFMTDSVSAASSKTIKLKITFVSAELIANNHVGNEWATSGFVNQKEITEGSSASLTLKSNESVRIKAAASELDKIPDFGSGEVSIKASAITKETTKSIKVIVKENRGRYAGNTAEWKFTFKISKQ